MRLSESGSPGSLGLVAAAFPPGEPRSFVGPVIRVTTYDVTVTLGGQSREYTAQVRYHEAGDGVSLEPEFVDPLVPGLQQVADDDAPLAVAPWARHVKTRRYAAVVKRITDLRRSGKRAVTDRAPIGALPGDDVTPQMEGMMTREVGSGPKPNIFRAYLPPRCWVLDLIPRPSESRRARRRATRSSVRRAGGSRSE